ncbi:MAG TPA: imidazole glycerol phosphate synthase subunit HisH [Bacteroidota bacterium]|jgi:glutamine amidotransferase
MIGVVDYEAGNIASVSNALSQIGTGFLVSNDPGQLASCDGVILPGVGAAPAAMASLRERNLLEFLATLDIPFLGICLGMELLYHYSEEGDTPCLGVLPGSVRKIDESACKVPHIGWNRVEFLGTHAIFEPEGRSEYYYFAHSYAARVDASTAGVVDCGIRLAAAVSNGNYFGVQFHPEKSGSAGLRLLKNFDALCKSYRR